MRRAKGGGGKHFIQMFFSGGIILRGTFVKMIIVSECIKPIGDLPLYGII